MWRYSNLCLILTLIAALSGGCSSGPAPSTQPAVSNPAAPASNVSMNRDDYPVFPNADAGADPSVSPEQGGKGFKGEGWETNTKFDLIGDPRALKGGLYRNYMLDFPGTLRMYGPESNSALNYMIKGMVYEPLLGMDYNGDLNFMPGLATHWQISPDKLTYRFRIDPNARWSDGEPVTTEDVIATWKFLIDDKLQDLTYSLIFKRFEPPVAESKYIVRVKSKELNWRNFQAFSGVGIFPAHTLKGVDGATYLRDFNFKMPPGSGPYIVQESDIEKGKSVTIRRRKDYWAEKARANAGVYNFDEVRYVVVRDPNLAYEMFKKGELDSYTVNRAKMWVEELNYDQIQRGLIQKKKIFNQSPSARQEIVFNMRREPFNDLRVRKALTLLLNRKLLIEKLMFNQYLPQNSAEPGTPYENPNNPKNEYNPEEAIKLLAEAGWNTRDSQGRLVKNGKPLTFELLYDSKTFDPHLTVFQEDLRKVGIGMNLRLVTPETSFKLLMERRFETAFQAWGSILFPNPEHNLSSRSADELNTNNLSGFKDKRVDDLIKQYNLEFDQQKRTEIMREIDGIVANTYPAINLWFAPFHRVIWWNKFGFPNGYLSRTSDEIGSGEGYGITQLWWIDPARQAKLDQTLKDPSLKLEVGPDEDRYWLEKVKQQAAALPKAAGGTN